MNDPLTVDPGRTALVVVDMQNDFCSTSGYYARVGRDVSALRAAVEPVGELLGRARTAGLPVVFTRLVHDPEHGAMEERHQLVPARWTAGGRRLVPGTWGADVVDALRPAPGELVVDKHGYSAFEGTPLEGRLRDRGVTTLLLAGVVTYACVLATAFSAFDRGFDVAVVSDAVGSWDGPLGTSTHGIVDLLLGRTVTADQLLIHPHESTSRP